MGLYKRILEEVSQEEIHGHKVVPPSYGRAWSLSALGAGGYVTEEDLEREEKRRERERVKVWQEEEKRSSEIRVLRALARQGAPSLVQGMAYRSLQRKYPAEWDRLRWGR